MTSSERTVGTPNAWEPDAWPVSDGRCPNCGRFASNRVAVVHGDDSGSVEATCSRCGPVKLLVIGWVDNQGNFS